MRGNNNNLGPRAPSVDNCTCSLPASPVDVRAKFVDGGRKRPVCMQRRRCRSAPLKLHDDRFLFRGYPGEDLILCQRGRVPGSQAPRCPAVRRRPPQALARRAPPPAQPRLFGGLAPASRGRLSCLGPPAERCPANLGPLAGPKVPCARSAGAPAPAPSRRGTHASRTQKA